MNCEKNKITCTCHNHDCPRYGKCCLCVAYHLEKGNLPVCLRAKENEATKIKNDNNPLLKT